MSSPLHLDANQILALAPDPASAKAGSQLSAAHHWSNLGNSEAALWGECQGSGKTPYKTQIDLNGPAFKCTCPSRKFRCKHGLGLYLLKAADPALFKASAEPQWVSDWLESRQARQDKKADNAAAAGAQDPALAAAQARKREEKREDKVDVSCASIRAPGRCARRSSARRTCATPMGVRSPCIPISATPGICWP